MPASARGHELRADTKGMQVHDLVVVRKAANLLICAFMYDGWMLYVGCRKYDDIRCMYTMSDLDIELVNCAGNRRAAAIDTRKHRVWIEKEFRTGQCFIHFHVSMAST